MTSLKETCQRLGLLARWLPRGIAGEAARKDVREMGGVMRVLLLHKYGRRAASFRHRFEQYIPYLDEAGLQCTVSSLLEEDYLKDMFLADRRNLFAVMRGIFRRVRVLVGVRKYDLVIIGQDLFPFAPAIFERYLNIRGVPYIFDYDDPIFHQYDMHRSPAVRLLLGRKLQAVIRGAELVFAGSPYIAAYARVVNANVEYLPTVVDLEVFRQLKDHRVRNGQFVVGWIGSPSTAVYLKALVPVLRRFCASTGARVVLVGSGPVDLPGVPTEIREWSEQTEVEEILRFDVGIMPMADDQWARGKCGFKLVQYMACGLPIIASPVGVSPVVVTDGVEGFLPPGDEGWLAAMHSLHADAELAARMGRAARKRVEAAYCLQVTAPRFVAGVQRVLAGTPK